MRTFAASPWAPSSLVLVVPIILGLALPAPAWAEWGMAAFLAAGLWFFGRHHPAAFREARIVVVASLVTEFCAAPLLGWYDYQQWAVPPWVPVGHGTIWLVAKTMPLERFQAVPVIVVLVAAQAAWMLGHQRLDVTGLVALSILVAAIVTRWKTPGFVAALAFLVWWVEIWGTTVFGVWHWIPDVRGLPEISPPGSAAGGYLALLEAPGLIAAAWVGSRFSRRDKACQA